MRNGPPESDFNRWYFAPRSAAPAAFFIAAAWPHLGDSERMHALHRQYFGAAMERPAAQAAAE